MKDYLYFGFLSSSVMRFDDIRKKLLDVTEK